MTESEQIVACADAASLVRTQITEPLALLRREWTGFFTDFFAELDRSRWAENACGHILAAVGRFLPRLEQVAGWDLHERLPNIPTWILLDFSPQLPPQDISGALRAVASHPRFVCRGLPAAATLLVGAQDGASPPELGERLAAVLADTRTHSALDWLGYFRDRLFPPPPRRRTDGRKVRRKPRPGRLVGDPRDLDAVERMLGGWRPTGSVAPRPDPYLSECQSLILQELLQGGAIDPDGKLTRTQIVKRVRGENSTSDLDHEIAELKVMKYTDSRPGRCGGVWLTEAGRIRAGRLAAANRRD